jgi:hypothetical protein
VFGVVWRSNSSDQEAMAFFENPGGLVLIFSLVWFRSLGGESIKYKQESYRSLYVILM